MYNTEVCSIYIKQRTIELKQIFGACNHFLFWGSKSFILYGKSNFNDFQWYDEWKLPVLRLNHLWGIWNSGVQTHLRFVLVFHPWHKTQFVSKINFKHETVRHAWWSQKQNKHPIVRQSIATAMHPPVGDVKSYFMFVLSPFKTMQKFKKWQENWNTAKSPVSRLENINTPIFETPHAKSIWSQDKKSEVI